jgi:monoamine oxidase
MLPVLQGCVIKTITRYARAWWRDKGLSGSLFSDEGPVRAVLVVVIVDMH